MRSPTLLTAAATLALTFVTGCSSDIEDPPVRAERGSGPWSFTDGSGELVEVDHTPTRIIAHAGAAAALLSYGIEPVGIYADESVETDANLKDLDLSGIEILGEEWGSIDVAKAATLNPDLIVADWWPVEKAHSGIENGVKKKSKELAELAPMVGPSQGDSIVDLAQGYEDLAESLGADVDSPELSKDKRAFETARDDFKDLMAEKDITALGVSPAADLLYAANPKYAPELQDFRSWGLGVITPDDVEKSFPYWENLSWENADKYQPDVLMIDSRSFDEALKAAEEQPTWTSIRAAKRGQIVNWPAFWLHTWGDYAEALETLTGELAEVDDSVGE